MSNEDEWSCGLLSASASPRHASARLTFGANTETEDFSLTIVISTEDIRVLLVHHI